MLPHRFFHRRSLLLTSLLLAAAAPGADASVVLPALAPYLVDRYDFEHPVSGTPGQEQDLGLSGTNITLLNGGAAMRVSDGAWSGSTLSIQTQQVNPTVQGNDDWKAGLYSATGVPTLHAFNAASGITLMGWVKPTGTNPNLNSETTSPTDVYNAIGLFGLLSGNSDGHAVRALLEIIDVSGTLKLVALGRRLDSGSSLTFAATANWQDLIPLNTWTHLTATFDFDNGTMALFANGQPIAGTYNTSGDPWAIVGAPEPDVTSATDPAGIKIGGSYPQNTAEKNAFNGRFDDLMFFNKSLTPTEVQAQFQAFTAVPEPSTMALLALGVVGLINRRRRGA